MSRVLSRAALCCLCCCLSSVVASAQDPARKVEQEADKARVVQLIEASRKGEIEVRWIAFAVEGGRLTAVNKTNEALKVVFPPAMTAEHIVPADGKTPRAQTLGIGPAAGRGYLGNGFFQQEEESYFFLPPGKSAKVDLPSVCLDFGKPDPTRTKPYEIRPVTAFTNAATIERLLVRWRRDRFSQPVAQAAAWHLANGVTWDKLARLPSQGTAFVPGRPMFSRDLLEAAQRLVQAIRDEERAAAQ